MAKYTEWLTDDGLQKIKKWARLGLTDKQIASNMEIRESTFYDWKKKFAEFSETLKKGRSQSVEILENTMFKKANGFYENDNYYPPDNVSLIFLLKNWAKETYRDRPLNKLETEKLKAETEKIKLDNKLKQKLLNGDEEADKLDQLLKGLDNATIINAEDVSK